MGYGANTSDRNGFNHFIVHLLKKGKIDLEEWAIGIPEIENF
jgi:hypothetical protein